MKLSDVLTRRVRGFRVIDLVALATVLTLALTVYAFKTSAGAERTDIADIESQIHDETRTVRLLQDQVHRLESPDRLERLARDDGQAPVNALREVTPEALATTALSAAPTPAAAPAPATPTLPPAMSNATTEVAAQ
jgi:cell division protein FtsL